MTRITDEMLRSPLTNEMLMDQARGFPRRIPEGAILIEPFSLRPLDEIGHIVDDVRDQLDQAEAPVTGRRTACVLVSEQRGYGGHVVERSPTDMEGAFDMAIDQIPSSSVQIFGAVVAGSGPVKEKHILPARGDLARLSDFLIARASIVVVQPGQWDLGRTIPLSRLRDSYEPKVASVFSGRTVQHSRIEAITNTTLSPEDCEFVAHLRHSGLDEGIHYYLTGSGAGRGGPSVALRPQLYNDLDIIAVSDRPEAEVSASFEGVAESQYGALQKEPKTPRVAGTDRLLSGWLYHNENVGIDFFPADRLESAFVRPEYLENNLFHKLS